MRNQNSTGEGTIDVVRHGATEYTGMPGDLTEQGKQSIEAVATQIADTINSEDEIVVIWYSPAERTKTTAGVIADILNQRGIEIARLTELDGLIDKRITPDRMVTQYKQSAHVNLSDEEIQQRLIRREKELTPNIDPDGKPQKESSQKVYERMRNLFEHALRSTRIEDVEGRKVRIIMVTHNSTMAEVPVMLGFIPRIQDLPIAAHLNFSSIPGTSLFTVTMGNESADIAFDRNERAFRDTKTQFNIDMMLDSSPGL